MDKDNPVSSFERAKIVAESLVTIGTKKTISFTKRAFLSYDQKIKETKKVDEEIAEMIFKNLSLLKGTAIKISQALVLHDLIPPSLEKKLEKSYNNVNPLSQALIIKVLENEFGVTYNKIFQTIDLKPFASASLGQVHLATTHLDEKLAVKIQYPSIDKTIQNDLKLISNITKFKKIFKSILEEIIERLYEEIDYRRELYNTMWAYDNFFEKDIFVPKVYKEYSTKHILATSYIQGEDLHKWMQYSRSESEKSKIANLMFYVFTKSVFELNKIQADPNPANYLVTPDTKLVLIDFGCIKEFNTGFIEKYKELFKIHKLNNKDEILNIYKEMDFIDDISKIDDMLFSSIKEFNTWIVEPFENNNFLFTKVYLAKGAKFAKIFTVKPFNLVKDFVFLDRTMHGLFSLFSKMEVKIDMRYFNSFIK
jgi:predicted unusual protein kinase regulating ubiquinone biosynthesis (AarF/ABC1/UbiB family)